MKQKTERIYWVDSLRGLAIVMMIIFHFAFDLHYMKLADLELYSGFWLVFVRAIQFLFLSLVGVSMHLSFKSKSDYKMFLHFQMKRALKLFGVALIITLVSYLIIPKGYIRFGVIHLISVSIAVCALLIRYPRLLAVLIIMFPIAGKFLSKIHVVTSLLLPFGIMPRAFYTVDYFPIFPWMSVVFAGIVAAYLLDHFKLLKNGFYPKRFVPLESIGKRSLLIYLTHQPVLIAIIYLLFK